MIGLLSHGIARIEHLTEFLGEPWCFLKRYSAPRCDRVAAWSLRPTSAKARLYAEKHGLPFVMLEDGFLRSVGLGRDDPPLALVVDDLGIYYDATAPSRLESLIVAPHSDAQMTRASHLIQAWRTARVSKYNHAREHHHRFAHLPDGDAISSRYILVVDQTLGDASIKYGMADPGSFQRMLDTALADHPDCSVLLKVHPEVMAGRKRGHFDLTTLAHNPRVHVLGRDLHPVSLIEHAQMVYVVTSQMGFEALLWGKRVRTFGMPFYAGLGLTQDELPAPARRHPVPLENLAHAALVEYPRYIDPETGTRCEVERVLDYLALQRCLRERYPAEVYALNFSLWKQPIVRAFLQGSVVRFVRNSSKVPNGSTLVVWGKDAVTTGTVAQPKITITEQEINIIRLEDGFLRSVGLGADLVRPLSWVMDGRGIYYDATTPSDLEHLLQHHIFDAATIERASRLRAAIVQHGLTKYNVGTGQWTRPAGDARIILVPGQVESDASIRYGAPAIRTNLNLLQAVREANPSAYVVYKPHPDVRAGLRSAGEGEADAGKWCDEIIGDESMNTLLDTVDEVHVLTSLTGFEALLRGKQVVTYGQPFFAGWGLTKDMAPPIRRTRRLQLDELVAGVLIEYPTYVSRTTGRYTTPERALQELLAWRQTGIGLPWWRKGLRWILRWRSN